MSDVPAKAIACENHGALPWEGHVVCAGCGSVYQTTDAAGERFAPKACPCGHRLMPARTQLNEALAFSAKPLCAACFRERTAIATDPVKAEDVVSIPVGARMPKIESRPPVGLRRAGGVR